MAAPPPPPPPAQVQQDAAGAGNGGDPPPRGTMTLAEFVASGLPKWNPAPSLSKSPLEGNPATNLWAATQMKKFRLDGTAFSITHRDFSTARMGIMIENFRTYLETEGHRIIGMNPDYRPLSESPYTEAEAVTGTHDVLLRPIVEYATAHWYSLEGIDMEDLPCNRICLELLREESVTYSVSTIAPPTQAVAQGRTTRTLRIDSIIALRPVGRTVEGNDHVMVTRKKIKDEADAKDYTPLKFSYLPQGLWWTESLPDEDIIFDWFEAIKTVMAAEFKRAGMLKKAFFDKLARLGWTFGTKPTFTAQDSAELQTGVQSLCAILAQAAHYWVRYGPTLMVLCDYESTVILEMKGDVDGNYFNANGTVKTDKMITIHWMHIDNGKNANELAGNPTSREFLAALLYSVGLDFKAFLRKLVAAIKAKKAEDEAKAKGTKEDDDPETGKGPGGKPGARGGKPGGPGGKPGAQGGNPGRPGGKPGGQGGRP